MEKINRYIHFDCNTNKPLRTKKNEEQRGLLLGRHLFPLREVDALLQPREKKTKVRKNEREGKE
jgi:hypothetical protein